MMAAVRCLRKSRYAKKAINVSPKNKRKRVGDLESKIERTRFGQSESQSSVLQRLPLPQSLDLAPGRRWDEVDLLLLLLLEDEEDYMHE
jgi:hypothetical protein